MSVHKAITEHVNKQNKKINDFQYLDQQLVKVEMVKEFTLK